MRLRTRMSQQRHRSGRVRPSRNRILWMTESLCWILSSRSSCKLFLRGIQRRQGFANWPWCSILSIRSLAPAPQHKSTESAAFRAALVFGQEYGILAASAEDRPFVPVSSVVICSRDRSPNVTEAESVPEGMRQAFRKWDNSKGLGICRVLPLAAALEATGVTRGSDQKSGPL